jgi:hypothetical protein
MVGFSQTIVAGDYAENTITSEPAGGLQNSYSRLGNYACHKENTNRLFEWGTRLASAV